MHSSRRDQLADKLSASFGRAYAEVILLAASQRRTLDAAAEKLDALHPEAVAAHLAKVNQLDGIRMAALVILRGTHAIRNPELTERLPADHTRSMLNAWHMDEHDAEQPLRPRPPQA